MKKSLEGQRKCTENDFLEGPHEEGDIHCKALIQGKKVAFNGGTRSEKKRLRWMVT